MENVEFEFDNKHENLILSLEPPSPSPASTSRKRKAACDAIQDWADGKPEKSRNKSNPERILQVESVNGSDSDEMPAWNHSKTKQPENPMLVEEILKKTLGYLQVADQFKCRPVCRLWNSCALKHIRKVGRTLRTSETTFSELNRIFSSPDLGLPITGIHVDTRLTRGILTFLSRHVTQIKTLEVLMYNSASNYYVTKRRDRAQIETRSLNQILRALPNIEELTLYKLPDPRTCHARLWLPTQLHSLRILRLGRPANCFWTYSTIFIKRLLGCSPNLRRVEAHCDPSFSLLEELLEALVTVPASGRIRSLFLQGTASARAIQSMSRLQFPLDELTIECLEPDEELNGPHPFEAVIQIHGSTLRELTIGEIPRVAGPGSGGLVLPSMPVLQSLRVYRSEGLANIGVAQNCFPVLKEIVGSTTLLKKVFMTQHGASFPTVRHLRVVKNFDFKGELEVEKDEEACLQGLQKVFPNLKSLAIDTNFGLPIFQTILSQVPRLERLIVHAINGDLIGWFEKQSPLWPAGEIDLNTLELEIVGPPGIEPSDIWYRSQYVSDESIKFLLKIGRLKTLILDNINISESSRLLLEQRHLKLELSASP